MSDWDLKEETITARQWVRSWRQEFFTDFGTNFSMEAHMEQVTMLPDGTIAKKPLRSVVRRFSEVGTDPRVQQINSLLTELINEWRLEDMNKQEYNSKLEG